MKLKPKTAIMGALLFLLISPLVVLAQEDQSVWWPDPTRMVVVSWPLFNPSGTLETVEAYLYYAYPNGTPMFQFGEADGKWFTVNHALSPGITSEVVEVGRFEWRYLNTDQITYTRVSYPVQVVVTEVTVLKFEAVTPETILHLRPVTGSRLVARVRVGEYQLHTNPDYRGEFHFRLGELFSEFPEGSTLQVMFGVENPVRARVIRPHDRESRDWR